jgi:carbonic anhydrase
MSKHLHLEALNMSRKRITGSCLLAFSGLCFALFVVTPFGFSQVLEAPEKAEPGHVHAHHHLHMQIGEEACAPKFTYEDGPTGPGHWPSACSSGRMQAPIDIEKAEKLPIQETLKIAYQPFDLDLVNDCNQYRIVLKVPDNYWVRVRRAPYDLAEIHFRVPGETAVNGKRPRMSIQFVHYSPEGVYAIIEVPVVAGKENPAMKEILDHIPAPGKENVVQNAKIDPMDLLPANHTSFYRYPGSLSTPNCNEGGTWYVMKNPVEFSEAQIAAYSKYYHDTARPLQPANGRPMAESYGELPKAASR